jgi:prepilin-type N-terminal cleavage/methylation domain-containing protein
MKKGFTLIELLIVVSIIGILAVALIPSLTDAPARARDAGRKAGVNEIVAAVESYNIDNGNYPTGNFCIDPVADCGAAAAGSSDEFICDYLGNQPLESTTTTGVAVDPAVVDGDAGEFGCDNGTNAYAEYEASTGGYQIGILTETGDGSYAVDRSS